VSLSGNRTFVGFGFGPIQGGLFLLEAFQSKNFRRLVVAEVLPDVVEAVRRAKGWYSVNLAHSDHVAKARVGPIQIENPELESERARLIEAIAEAEEIATCVPSVQDYVKAGPGSLHRLLAEGLRRKVGRSGPRAILYAAENHNHAAQILEAAVLSEIPAAEKAAVCARVQFLNTVIGKMSRVVAEPDEVRALNLAPITPGYGRAFLVESFNRILISKVRFGGTPEEPAFRRGLKIFEEKEDLLPFEEAKLFGHNAIHALAAYVGGIRGIERIADVRQVPDLMNFLRAAFVEESGEALVRKHTGVDPLFTREGYRHYAEDLLARMTNPYLHDTVERVGRDPERKLGWDDRLVGTIRIALEQGIQARRFAFGTAAALARLNRSFLKEEMPLRPVLEPLWRDSSPVEHEKAAVLRLIEQGHVELRHWYASGFPNLEVLFSRAG